MLIINSVVVNILEIIVIFYSHLSLLSVTILETELKRQPSNKVVNESYISN